jgi:hypothetical protein
MRTSLKVPDRFGKVKFQCNLIKFRQKSGDADEKCLYTAGLQASFRAPVQATDQATNYPFSS